MSSDLPSDSGAVRPKFQIRSLVWSVYAPSFMLTLGQGLLIPVLPIFADNEFAASAFLIAFIVTARPLGTMIFDVPAGILVSVFGLRRIMLGGVLLFAVASVIGGLSPNVGTLIAARLLAGVSFALWSISRHVYIAQTVPMGNRGKALSMFGGISRIAGIAGFFLGGVLFGVIDERAPFFAQAVVAVITAMMVLLTFKGSLREETKTPSHNIFPMLGHTLYDSRGIFATAGVAAITLQFLRAARELIFPLAVNEIAESETEAGILSGTLFGVMSVIDSVMFPVVGYVMDRWGRKHIGVPAYLVLAGSFALVPLATTFPLLMVAGVLVGLGNGLSSGLVLTMGVDFAPKDSPGEFLGVWRFISDAGGASGPVVIGGIVQALTLGAASVATAGIGGVGALILLFLVRETLVKEPEPERPRAASSG